MTEISEEVLLRTKGIGAEDLAEYATKREMFAAMAMQGLCACSIAGNHKSFNVLAKEAVEYADALMKELAKEQK